MICSVTVRFCFTKYRKFPIISPGLIFVQKAFLLGLFSGELIFGSNFAFQNGLSLTITQLALKVHGLIFRKVLILSEGFLRLRFGGLIFGGAYLFIYFLRGGEGGLILGILRYYQVIT